MVRPRKPRLANRIPADCEDFWEDYAVLVLMNQPVSSWKAQEGLWQRLPLHSLASAKRVIFTAIKICSERGEPLPQFLLLTIENLLQIKRRRTTAKKSCAFNKAREIISNDPNVSDNSLARQLGVSRPSAHDWKTIIKDLIKTTLKSNLPEYEP